MVIHPLVEVVQVHQHAAELEILQRKQLVLGFSVPFFLAFAECRLNQGLRFLLNIEGVLPPHAVNESRDNRLQRIAFPRVVDFEAVVRALPRLQVDLLGGHEASLVLLESFGCHRRSLRLHVGHCSDHFNNNKGERLTD